MKPTICLKCLVQTVSRMMIIYFLALAAFNELSVSAGSLVQQYFPMHDGDWRYYQDHDASYNTTTEIFTQTIYNGHPVFSLNFHDERTITSLGTGTWYLGNSGTALTLYGINTAWGNLPFNSPANLMTDQALTNNGTNTSSVTGSIYGSTVNITIRATISSVGTITVPAGTFNNCKLLLVSETATLSGVFLQSYDSAAWALAPGVGIIADGVATWDSNTGTFTFKDLFGNPEDYFELVSRSIYVPPDLTPPKVAISQPTSGQRLNSGTVTVTGAASDDVQVAGVFLQLNGNGLLLATGTANWSANLSPTPGTNIVRAYAVDTSGNKSVTNTVSFVYVVAAPLGVQTNGVGMVSPNYNGQQLEMGKSFTMAATAGNGFAFVNWTGSLTTNTAKFSFVMASNLTFTANFKDITRPVNIINTPTAN